MMLYNINQAIRSISQRKTSCLIMVLAFALGYFALYVPLTHGEAGLYNYETMQIKKDGLYVEYSKDMDYFPITPINRQPIDQFLSQQAMVGAGGTYTCVTDVYYEEMSTGKKEYFHMVDERFGDYFNVHMKVGRFFSDSDFANEVNVCVVEEGYKQTGLGETVYLMNEPYVIVGVMGTVLFRSSVLIPQNVRHDNAICSFKIAIEGEAANLGQIDWNANAVQEIKLQYMDTAKNYSSKIGKSVFATFGTIFAICLIFFVYMLLNTLNILKNQALAETPSMGIRMTFGARKADVTMQFFIEITILVLIADLLIFALDPFIAPIINTTFEHRLGPLSILFMIASSILSAYILARAVLRRILSKPAIWLISGRVS